MVPLVQLVVDFDDKFPETFSTAKNAVNRLYLSDLGV